VLAVEDHPCRCWKERVSACTSHLLAQLAAAHPSPSISVGNKILVRFCTFVCAHSFGVRNQLNLNERRAPALALPLLIERVSPSRGSVSGRILAHSAPLPSQVSYSFHPNQAFVAWSHQTSANGGAHEKADEEKCVRPND
jgi:hypothetical protein